MQYSSSDITGNKNHFVPNTFVSFHYCFAKLIRKTYLGQHLSSELKKEKNKTEMDWTSLPKYGHHLIMACHLLASYNTSPSYCSKIYSCYCDQNTLWMRLFFIWWQACRGQLGPYLAVKSSSVYLFNYFGPFLDFLYTTFRKLDSSSFTNLILDIVNLI